MKFQEEIQMLLDEKVIDDETAKRISVYYLRKRKGSHGRLSTVYSVLGAILAGLGIILILAHNWDEFPRTVKVGFAFLPLLTGQLWCGYSLLKDNNNVWKESAAVFLSLAVGACIALISQIYHLPDDLLSFLFVWSLLILPVIYIMGSFTTAYLYAVLVTWYACEKFYGADSEQFYLYYLLIAGVFPFYFRSIKNNPEGNFAVFLHWVLALSLTICLGIVHDEQPGLVLMNYFLFFCLIFNASAYKLFSPLAVYKNAWLVAGFSGIMVVLFMLSFNFYWNYVIDLYPAEVFFSKEGSVSFILLLLNIIVIFTLHKKIGFLQILPFLMYMIFILGVFYNGMEWMVNLILLIIGWMYLQKGFRENHLGKMNIGILIIDILIICRFFDTHLSFILRGKLFLIAGAGFFLANFLLLKRRRLHEQ